MVLLEYYYTGERIYLDMSRAEKGQTPRVKLHVDGMSLGIRSEELRQAPPAVTPEIERKLTGEATQGKISRVVTGAIDSLSALPRAIRALGRNRDYIVKPSTGDVIERPDTYNSGSEKKQAEERAGREKDTIIPGRVARAAAITAEPIDVFDRDESDEGDQPDDQNEQGFDGFDRLEVQRRRTAGETLADLFPNYAAAQVRRIEEAEKHDPAAQELRRQANFEALSQPAGFSTGTVWDENMEPED